MQNVRQHNSWRRRWPSGTVVVIMVALALMMGCSVYFNTFFNAQKSFNKAEKTRQATERKGAGQREYQAAVVKALKVVENHPNSKYYDDAVWVLAVSYFHLGQYSRAERRFREILANFEESEFATEANLYLAKTKLELGEIADAMIVFEDIFEADYEMVYKAEAASALGEYYDQEKEYDRARQYYRAVRDSLGTGDEILLAQQAIADTYFDDFMFRDALGGYLQVLGMDPDKNQKYHASFRAAVASFRLQRIDEGLEYLQDLADDELYYDSLGILRLTMAHGYEYDEDLAQAEVTYEDIITTVERRIWRAEAFHRLGLIYQFDYDQLLEAKEYYDQCVEAQRGSAAGRDALQRSSDIGKLATFARSLLDTNATAAVIDEAAYTQYLLSELYWFNLNKPDTAIAEMQYLVDSFATSYYAPKGLIALAQMIRTQREDNVLADSLLKSVLWAYSGSDFVPEALTSLGLLGTAADSGYAALYVDRAEDFIIGEKQIDSARTLYQYVVDNFPDSRFFVAAKFSLIWLTETYQAPGDSSVILAYQEFADSFPGNAFAREALARISSETGARRRSEPTTTPEGTDTTDELAAGAVNEWGDTVSYIDPIVATYHRPNGDTLVDLRLEPIEIVEPFEFPAEASVGQQYDWLLYFQVLIDVSGKVVDYVLKIPSGIEEIDELAIETVGSMTFDAMAVSNRIVDAVLTDKESTDGNWFVYQYTVSKPEYLR